MSLWTVDLQALPTISFLALYLPDRPSKTAESFVRNVDVIVAHREVVLLKAGFRTKLS